MNNLQDVLSLLPPITVSILIVVGLLTAVIKLIEQIKILWSNLKPAIKYLVLLVTQIIPTGIVVWYYMYWAVQYHDRFTEPVVFLLLIAEPTILIIVYEMFWGTWLYPKLLSFARQKANARQSSGADLNENSKQKSDIKSPSNKKRQ